MSNTIAITLIFHKAEKFSKKGLSCALPTHGCFPKHAIPMVGDSLRFHDVGYVAGELATFKVTSRAFLTGSTTQPWAAELSLDLVETAKKKRIAPVVIVETEAEAATV